MKENILDVLMYLFENYMDEDNQLHENEEVLRVELVEAGFENNQVGMAFEWLESLSDQSYEIKPQYDSSAIRVFSERECDRLDLEARGFLLSLEQLGVLDSSSRELIIDRAMALNPADLNLEQLKWVILMVLLNQPGYEAAFAWMENFMYNEYQQEAVH